MSARITILSFLTDNGLIRYGKAQTLLDNMTGEIEEQTIKRVLEILDKFYHTTRWYNELTACKYTEALSKHFKKEFEVKE